MTPSQAALAQQLRMPMVPGSGQELRTLEDVMAAKDREMEKEIQTNIDKHIRWNEGFVDKTMAPLTPELEPEHPEPDDHFREAMAASVYLPTPPASVSDEESHPHHDGADVVMKDVARPPTPIRYATPPSEDQGTQMPSFRRRLGRGGRIMIDRKLPRPKRDPADDDRFKYDSDDDDSSVSSSRTDDVLGRMIQRAYLIGNSRPTETQTSSARKAQHEAGGPSQSSPAGPQPSTQPQPTPAPS